jgi:hypothetical protein
MFWPIRIAITVAALAALSSPAFALERSRSSPEGVVDAHSQAASLKGLSDLSVPAPQDFQSPDAQDAARNPVTTYTPGDISVPAVQVQVRETQSSSGFDWGDAGIGGAGVLAIVALAGGTMLLVGHRRRGRGVPAATA